MTGHWLDCSAAFICCPSYWPIDGADAGFDPIDHTQGRSTVGLVGRRARAGRAQGSDGRSDRESYFEPVTAIHRLSKARRCVVLRIHVPHLRPCFPWVVQPKRSYCRSIARGQGFRLQKCSMDDGTERLLWTTFTSEQIDIDVRSSQGKRYLDQILNQFHAAAFGPSGWTPQVMPSRSGVRAVS